MGRVTRVVRRGWDPVHFGGRVLWDAIVHFLNDNSLTIAGHIAYMTLFALFPFIIFVSTLGGFLGQAEAAARFIEYLLEGLPQEVAGTLEPAVREITREQRTGLMTVSIVVTLWVASSGLEALRVALNEAYNAEQAPAIWWARLQSLGLTILFAVGIILAMIAIIAGPFIWAVLEWVLVLPDFYGWLYGVSRYIFGIVILYIIITVLYFVLPNRSLRRSEVLPGAGVAVGLWILSASLFSLYLANLGRYSLTYGSLGGIVVTLLFFYVSACIFIFGAEINAAYRRRKVARRAAALAHHGSSGSGALAKPGERG